MLHKTQLETMLDLQNKMNVKVNSEWLSAGYGYLRAAMIEAVEAMEHHGWKWWKAQDMDIAQLQMEMIDIWHFALSYYLIENHGNMEESVSQIANELDSSSCQVLFDNKSYDFSQMSLLDNLQLMTGLCAANRFDSALFMHIATQTELTQDKLYQQYVGKNVLNFFRQDHGYKSGSYIKMWHGKEDNEYLVAILDKLNIDDSAYADKIYRELKNAYPQ